MTQEDHGMVKVGKDPRDPSCPTVERLATTVTCPAAETPANSGISTTRVPNPMGLSTVHEIHSACARVYRAILDKPGVLTYRLLTEQLILSLNHPREEVRTHRFCLGLPRLLLQPLVGPAWFPHGSAYDGIQEGSFS